MKSKKVFLVPLDPVHDVGLKVIKKGLEEAGHETILLPPDLSVEEIVHELSETKADTLLVSRTLGYGIGETLGRLMDLLDSAGIRDTLRTAIGGMAIRPELAAELGFDAGFGPGTTVEEAVAFVEEREYDNSLVKKVKEKVDFTQGYSYNFKNLRIKELLDVIAGNILEWAQDKTSPGVKRADLREELWDADKWRNYEPVDDFFAEYLRHCGEGPQDYYLNGTLHPKTRRFTREEVIALEKYVRKTQDLMMSPSLRYTQKKPLVFNQYGTGCPFLDIGHIKVSEAWGADGVIHFDPSWGARTEGLYDGFLTHENDGTVVTPANLNRIKKSLEPGTYWQVRAHRGLNTPETVVLAGKLGADLTKININYGALGAGTDPARLTVDGLCAMRYAAKYNLPYDVVTNEELCGVPAHKAFAGMLISVYLGILLGGKPVLQPLFCYSPEVMVSRTMEDNYVEFNVAKITALREIIDAPVWPGAPIGFLTHTEERVQSSVTTAYHACAATMMGVDAITIASSDEAYSGGPISVPSKIDTLKSVGEGFRFFGNLTLQPTEQIKLWSEELISGIEGVLSQVAEKGDYVQALHEGILGSREDGAYPGRNGRDTVLEISRK